MLLKKINIEAKKIAKGFNLDEKLNIMAKEQSFVTIKNNKPNFCTNPKYRLLNPTKDELSKLSKHISQIIDVNASPIHYSVSIIEKINSLELQYISVKVFVYEKYQ